MARALLVLFVGALVAACGPKRPPRIDAPPPEYEAPEPFADEDAGTDAEPGN